MTGYPLRLAIVGCGAVVTAFHLPASLLVPEVDVVALVDENANHARSLAGRYGIPMWAANYGQIFGHVDAALIAVPSSAHRSVACDLMRAGIHVLCEKPLAPTVQDCQRMLASADAGGVLLATAHSRRFHHNIHVLKTLIELNALGEIYYVKVQDGFVFSWPTQTAYMFRSSTAAGVLLETGIHVIDTLLWLFGAVEEVRYRDDALGGVESNVEMMLRFERKTVAEVKISRTANLSNVLEVYGALGWARCDVYEGQFLDLHLPASSIGTAFGGLVVSADTPQDNQSIMAWQLEDFAQSVVERRRPRATGEDGLKAVGLVETCYGQRKARSLPLRAPLPGVVQ